MPGPLSHPEGGKTRANRNKPAHSHREALGKGMHRPGSQNRNKNRGRS